MGGIIAQALAYERSRLISGMVLIASQPDYSYIPWVDYIPWCVICGKILDVKIIEKLTELFFLSYRIIEFRKYLASSILHITGYVYPLMSTHNSCKINPSKNWLQQVEQLEQLHLPVLITTARNDMVTNLKTKLVLAYEIEELQINQLPN